MFLTACAPPLQLYDGQRGYEEASEAAPPRHGAPSPPLPQQQAGHSAFASRQTGSGGSPRSFRPQSPAPASLPASLIYKTSCEYFSWPLLEPQVRERV